MAIAGKVRMTPKGAWNKNADYEILDVVTTQNGSRAHIAKKAVPGGTEIDNAEYWDTIADVSPAITNANTATAGANAAAKSANDAAETASTAAENANEATQKCNEATDALPETVSNMFADLGLVMVDGKLCVKVERA